MRLTAKSLLPYYVFTLFVLFVATIALKQYHLLYGLHFPDYDLGIFTQGIYKLSRFEAPFVTIRGVNLFGDHLTLVNLLFVPLFWLFPHPLVLLFGQTLVLGAGGLILYEICKVRLKSPLLIALVVTLFYFYPPLLHLSLRQYHPNAFAILFGLLFWLGFEKKNRLLATMACIALFLTKENMPLLAGGLAFYMWAVKRWKFALYLWLSSIIAFILIMKVIIPGFSGITEYPFANRTLGTLIGWLSGESSFSWFAENTILRKENPEYLRGLFLPLMFLPLLRPGVFLLNPLFHLNILTDWVYAHSIFYQYTAGVIATMMIATVQAVGFLEEKYTRSGRNGPVLTVTIATVLVVIVNLEVIGPRYLRFRSIYSDRPPVEKEIRADIKEVLAVVKDRPISTHYLLIPQFATRDLTFMWPNPFKNSNYGYLFTETHEAKPEYVVWIDTIPFDQMSRELLDEWGFRLARKYDRLLLFKRATTSDSE